MFQYDGIHNGGFGFSGGGEFVPPGQIAKEFIRIRRRRIQMHRHFGIPGDLARQRQVALLSVIPEISLTDRRFDRDGTIATAEREREQHERQDESGAHTREFCIMIMHVSLTPYWIPRVVSRQFSCFSSWSVAGGGNCFISAAQALGWGFCMTGFLRFVRILNVAVWCGASVFLVAGLPGLFSPQLEELLTKPYVGFAAEAVLRRYFILYYCCGALALLCLAGEWVYSGKGSRLDLSLLCALNAAGLVFGLALQPRLHLWHYLKYFGRTPEQQANAARLFALWHGLSQMMNLLVIMGLIFYLWRTTRPPESPRFSGFAKIRG
jgi:hypothetical protein